MVEVIFLDKFRRTFKKIKDKSTKDKLRTVIRRIKDNPEVDKPLQNVRKGTRELYVKHYRLSYTYDPDKKLVYILDLYHKKFQ